VQVLATMTQLNKVGQQLSETEGVRAMTDVTGFGLAGHLLEVARGSGVAACVDFGKVRAVRSVLVASNVQPPCLQRNSTCNQYTEKEIAAI
jgi:selenide,water dikinase